MVGFFYVHHLFIMSENQTISVGDNPTCILVNLILVKKTS